MDVLFVSPSTDIAGLCHGMKTAFDRAAPGWTARSAARIPSPFGYPTDAPWSEARELYDRADVVHIMDNPAAFGRWPKRRRGVVVEHVGTRYRRDPKGLDAICRQMRAVQVTAGLDFPGLPWIPPVVDIDHLARLRAELYEPSEQVRIVHAPTHRALKSTAVIEAVVERLSRRHPIEFDLIEGVSWAECLRRKARADILVDELTYGYGLNALESWAMGMPVVSGIADAASRARMVSVFGGLPFLNATADTLERQLEAIVAEPNLRGVWAERGLALTREYHSAEAVVARTLAVYAVAA